MNEQEGPTQSGAPVSPFADQDKAYHKISSVHPKPPDESGTDLATALRIIAELRRDLTDLQNTKIDVTDGIVNNSGTLKGGLDIGYNAAAAGSASNNIASGLPIGKKGDLLYFNGLNWVVLSTPSADSVLTFDFTTTGLPLWVTLTPC